MARKYTKRSDYWNKFNKNNNLGDLAMSQASQEEYVPELLGESFYTSDASYKKVSTARVNTAGTSGSARVNSAALRNTIDRFSSIRKGMLPYEYAADGVNVREGIELCQKAYANVSVFRNAVDVMSEFANTEIYLEGGTKKSREFFNQFFKRINLQNLKDQYFREYYRSGNIFIYRFDGEFEVEDYARLMNQVGAINPSANKIPVKYVLLNPFDIVSKRATTFNVGAYEKVLSEYELSRLQNPATEEDQLIYDSLDPEMKKLVKDGSYYTDGIKIELDPKRLSFSFYKKQDYEPFAVPFGYPVLEDINAKLELKKMDQAITRTVENVILLITMGAEPEKGGINANNINAMQSLFKNESVGRVLVSDYTTKADFVIPDLNKVLGPAKYQILNEDIKQGLQNIVVGDEKYNSTQVKAQIFIDRLKEARSCFLNDFLQREIKRIANSLGFKSYPTATMKDIDMRDETQLMRVSTRLMELGILTPQQGMEMFHNGKFPNAEDIAPAQTAFIEQRKEGFYNPIVGGIPMIEPQMGEGSDEPQTVDTPKSAGRPNGTTTVDNEKLTRQNIQGTIYAVEAFNSLARERAEEKFGGDLNEQQEEMVNKLCESIICASKQNEWNQTLEACIDNFELIEELNVMNEVLSVANKHNLEVYPSAILYHSHEN
jgi:hypothetical protein